MPNGKKIITENFGISEWTPTPECFDKDIQFWHVPRITDSRLHVKDNHEFIIFSQPFVNISLFFQLNSLSFVLLE